VINTNLALILYRFLDIAFDRYIQIPLLCFNSPDGRVPLGWSP